MARCAPWLSRPYRGSAAIVPAGEFLQHPGPDELFPGNTLGLSHLLDGFGLARNFGFAPKELRRLQKLVIQHQAAFLEAWHGHLGADS